MRIIETDDLGIFHAALEIVRSHSADELARIVETANPLIARSIKALLARHGVQRARPAQRERRTQQTWPGRRTYREGV